MTFDLDQLARHTLASPPTVTPPLNAIHRMAEGRQRRKARRRAGAMVAACVVLIGGAWAALPTNSTTVETVSGAGEDTRVEMGEFVWPAPPRGFESPEDLAAAFISEELGWVDGIADVSQDQPAEPNSPTWLVLSEPDNETTIRALAMPSTAGWGFAQIGDGVTIRQDSPDTARVWFTSPPDATTTVTLRWADSAIELTTEQDFVELPDSPPWFQIVSTLVVHRSRNGLVVGVAGVQFASQDEPEPGVTPTTVSPADTGAVRSLDTIAEVEQLIDDYGSCIMANRDSGAFAIQLDRVKGTIGQAQTSHKVSAALDAIDAAESLCDSKLAFSSSVSLSDRYDEPTPDSEWIVFGRNPTGWEDADWIIEIHLDPARPLNRLDPLGQWLADHPDIASGTFQAPSTYRVVPRQSPIPEDLMTTISNLDDVIAVWRIAKPGGDK